jgi:hypothetical protein
MALKNLLGALAVAGAVYMLTGCPQQTPSAPAPAAGGTTAATTGGAATSGMDDDAKHKLYQAAAMTGDAATVMAVNKKIGIMKDDGTPTEAMTAFTTGHGEWAQKNVSFIQGLNTPEKAKEYVTANMK